MVVEGGEEEAAGVAEVAVVAEPPKKKLRTTRGSAALQVVAAAVASSTAGAEEHARHALDILGALPAEQRRQVVNSAGNEVLREAIRCLERNKVYAELPEYVKSK